MEGVTSGDYRRGVLKKTQGGTKPVTTGICKHLSCAFMEDNNKTVKGVLPLEQFGARSVNHFLTSLMG